MNLWSELEKCIKNHEIRVDERLELLEGLKADHETGKNSIEDRKNELMLRVDEATARLKKAMRE